ncbi:MAG: class I SAM-dependent methyltransferase [Magnetococcales bacterium]|nr:class I SAM-dependent methyltransferase [Magnetococcales bacterium]
MNLEATRLRNWYATAQGKVAADMVGSAMTRWLSRSTVDRTLTLGYPHPYLERIRTWSDQVFGASPAEMGVMPWPVQGNRFAQVRADALPFADALFDRVILVHLLEAVEEPHAVLREAWRVLKPLGRILLVVPNRQGLWARCEATPFASGTAFTPGAVRRVLEEALFEPRQAGFALYLPPWMGQRWHGFAPACEQAGQRWFAPFGGVLLNEAQKVVLARTPLGSPLETAKKRGKAIIPLTGKPSVRVRVRHKP